MSRPHRQRGSHVVTAFVRHRGALLLVKRGTDSSSPGRWDGVSRVLAEPPADPAAVARDPLARLGIEDATLVRRGDPIGDVADDDRVIHPALFDVASREVSPSIDAAEWVPAPELPQRPTVPGLWRAYRQVAPTVETVAADTEHGSAWISIQALAVLRDRAALADDYSTVADVARELRAAHPDMAALGNRINRAMARAVGVDDDDAAEGTASDTPTPAPSAVGAAAQRTLKEAVRADEAAAHRAAALLDGEDAVATLSRSSTVFDALVRAEPTVVIGESRPAGEGSDVAAELAAAGVAVTLTTDAALSAALSSEAELPAPDAVLVGADAVLPDGGVINKVGTRALGLAAAESAVPLYVVAASDKVALADRRPTDQSDPAPLGPAAGVDTWVPTFDRTSPELVDGIVTEDGVLAPVDIESVATRHRRHANWDAE